MTFIVRLGRINPQSFRLVSFRVQSSAVFWIHGTGKWHNIADVGILDEEINISSAAVVHAKRAMA